MASTKDIHDIMGMGSGGPVQKPANKKKKKVVEAQPRLSGISREVQALMGDSVPPVAIVETPRYKSKPSLANKLYRPRHWEERDFTPAARSDGLQLRHWKRALPVQRPQPAHGDGEMKDGEQESQQPDFQFEEEFPMQKWDVSIRVPEYTDEQYEKHFKADDWTKEETAYLMRLASDYNLRWILIADRYDPDEVQTPAGEGTGPGASRRYPPRTMEQLKHRYYQLAAQDLELRTPKSNMNPSEFQLWEKMRNFDAKTETLRKTMAEKLFERTKDEAEEERTLLEELHRITKNEEDFINMRRDLYARLEAAPSLRRNERGEEQNIVLSSAGLSDLLNRLFAKEKYLKRRVIPNGEAGANSAAQQTPVDARGSRPSNAARRDTTETPATEAQKKSSLAAPVPKQLSKAEEEKYGVSHPTERLTSGVSFRHEKINRITTAKSQVQTQKLNAALTELEIPARLSMPTEKVCKEFERLVGQIQLLLEARKTLTRVREEVKTLQEMRRQRLGEPAPGPEAAANGNSVEAGKTVDTTAPPRPDEAQVDHGAKATEDTAQKDGASKKVDEGPGPAVNEEDDDAEAEDDMEASNADRTQVEDEEDQDEANANDDSVAQRDEADDDDDEEAQNDDEDAEAEVEAEEEDEDDDEDDEGTAALRRGAENEDDDDEEPDTQVAPDEDEDEDAEEEEDEHEDSNIQAGAADSDNEDAEDEEQDVTMNEVEPAEGDPDEEAEKEGGDVEESRPTSAGSRAHKRGASVVSDASGAGSNRSGVGRKRKR